MTTSDTAIPEEAGMKSSQRRWRRWITAALMMTVLVLAARALGWLSWSSPTIAESMESTSNATPGTNETAGEAAGSRVPGAAAGPTDSGRPNAADTVSIRQRILGKWTRTLSGQWNLEIREDGSGTMTVTPDRFWALVVGSKITIEMTWDVRDGFAIFDSVRGEPATSFEIVMKMWKKHQERRILELTDDRFVYLSDDGKSQSVWTRVTDAPASP